MNNSPIADNYAGSVAPRSAGEFPSGVSLGIQGMLDADDMAKRALGSFRKSALPEDPQDAPDRSERINFSFKAKISGELEFTVQPGFAEVAPDTIISVTCNIIQTVTEGSAAWYGWVDVDSTAGTAIASFGDSWPTALTTEQKKTIRQQTILQIAMNDGIISAIKNLQCGDIEVFDPVKVPAPDAKTINLNATEGAPINGMLQIAGADTVVASSASFPMMSGPNVGETPKSVEWVQVDGANATPDASSLSIRGEAGAKRLEIKGFLAHVDESPTDGAGWAVIMNNCSPGMPDVKYVGFENFKTWLGFKDEKVKVSEGDTAGGYLAALITAGTTNVHLQATDGNLSISVDEVSGPSGTVAVGTTSTGEPGTSASVVNSGTETAAILDFTIPRGADGTNGADGANGTNGIDGANGADGAAATISVGTTTTGAPGTSASVSNSGTPSAAIFDFAIPRGDQGEQGIQGIQGETGAQGEQGIQGTPGTNGTDGIVSIVVTWDGGTCRPTLSAGGFWYLDDVTLVNHVQTFSMKQMCLPMYDVPGYCPHTGTVSVADATTGEALVFDVANGLITGSHEGELLQGINPSNGEPVTATIQANGTVTGYEGFMRIIDPTTGDSGLFRIGNDGTIRG